MDSAQLSSKQDKRSVLLLEVDVLLRNEVAAYLRHCGYGVIETANAGEALRILESDLPVHVAFLDLDAPSSKTGFDLAQWIRKSRPEIRVILSSGTKRTAKAAENLCEHGPLLTKPYDYQILEGHLRRLLAVKAPPGRTPALAR